MILVQTPEGVQHVRDHWWEYVFIPTREGEMSPRYHLPVMYEYTSRTVLHAFFLWAPILLFFVSFFRAFKFGWVEFVSQVQKWSMFEPEDFDR